MDNALEFKSQAFEDFCTTRGIVLTYSTPYEHAQNGLAEAYIKKIHLVVRPMLLHGKLPPQFWKHAVLHTVTLLRLCPTLLNSQSSLEVLSGAPPSVAHIRTFGCEVWVPISEPKQKTISSHRIKTTYLGFDLPSIVRHKIPRKEEIYKARFQNCKSIEHKFSEGINKHEPVNFKEVETLTKNPDRRTALTDSEVRKLLNLQKLAETIPDGFQSGLRIIRSPVRSSGNPAPPEPKKRKVNTRNRGTTMHTIKQEQIQRIENNTSDYIPNTIEQAKASPEWPQWKSAIEAEYNSLDQKRKIFRSNGN